MLGGNWVLHREYQHAVIRASLLEGEVYAVKDDGGEIASVAYWFGPDSCLFGSKAQRQLGFDTFFRKLSLETQIWWVDTYPRTVERLRPRVLSDEESNSLWWCYNLVTDAAARKRGYGTALIEAKYRQVACNGQIIGLAAAPDENVRFYKSIGFKERGGTIMSSPTGNFPVHCFVKKPP
ncbi:hypothetical protein BDN72DRAFT_850593 [Pluteus cervinus]|uniref:Uncharacterized protein n=1 Tax=Pluteus cervinus TaxID=181527 RepID=A0ACD3A3W5_9AGAR|nr:hypothetical protein BDN72DRAFT_850593 [Pluteus cervinus]